jgi:hypothetical protein
MACGTLNRKHRRQELAEGPLMPGRTSNARSPPMGQQYQYLLGCAKMRPGFFRPRRKAPLNTASSEVSRKGDP